MERPPPANDADWSSLPTDILISVLCKLEFPDVFCSAAVCASWRAAARALGNLGTTYACPQTPCLFYATTTGSGAELYSLAAGRSYRLPDLPGPPVADRYIWGSSHGWLVTADARSELQLLNPATGEQLALPSVATMEHVTPVFNDAGELRRYDLSFYNATLPRKESQPPQPYEVGDLREVLYLKAVLSCDPSLGDCTVMIIRNPFWQLSFARVGKEQWHWITNSSPLYTEYSDCIYQDDALYAITRQGGIHRYTIAGSCASCDMIFKDTLPYIAYNVYIARAPSDDVLQIWRFTDIEDEEPNEERTYGFEINKVDFEKQSVVRIDTLGVKSSTCPQTPCLFCATTTGSGAELYSLAAGRFYRLPDLPDPPVADRYIWGSSHGWLVTADAPSELHLLNPATGEQIGLPPISTMEHLTPVLDDAGKLIRYNLSYYNTTLPSKEPQPPHPYEVGELRGFLYLKAVLSCDPSEGDCIVMLIHHPMRQLSFARAGGRQWHWITTAPGYAEYSDCIYHNDAFYAMNLQGGIHRYTIEGSRASCDVIFKDTLQCMAYNVYIARTPSGDVLQIWRFTDDPSEGEEMHTDGFEIYKLDFDKQCRG